MSKAKKVFNKLIRDKIPEIIRQDRGSLAVTRVLDDVAYRQALKAKVVEEAEELLNALSKDETMNELADLEELIRAIAANYGISMDDLEKCRLQKEQTRGGFKKKLFLEYTEEPAKE